MLELVRGDNAVSKPLDEEEEMKREEDSPDNWSSSMLSQTPVIIYQDATEVPGAPQKSCLMYLCHTQMPPLGTLHEEWSLQPWMSGSWGYVFKYEVGELCLYQLGDGESLSPSTNMTVLTTVDWGMMMMMLRMVVPMNNKEVSAEKPNEEDTSDEKNEDVDATTSETGYCSEEEEEEEEEEKEENRKRVYSESESESAPQEKRPRMGIQFDDNELSKMKIILGALWQSRTTVSDKWMTHASLRSENWEGKRSVDIFVLEKLNPDCGLFCTVLVIPATEWLDRMLEIRERISNLFQSCRNWRTSMVCLLITHHVLMNDFRVQVVTGTLLHELRSVKKIYATLSDVYENLTGQDPVKINQLQILGDCYTVAC
ncbi:hypothetical protein ABVT39_027958 [Epinephelus coioides]